MSAGATRRWWLVALPAAAALLALLVLAEADRGGGRDSAAAAPAARSAAADVRARRALRRRAATRRPPRQVATRGEARESIARLSQLERTAEERQLLWIAEEDLVAACMRGRGFAYLPSPPDDEAPAQEPRRPDRGDVQAAAAVGYGIARSVARGAASAPADPNAEAMELMTAAQRDAYLVALRGPSLSPTDPSVRSAVESVPLPGGGAVYWYRDSCLARARGRLYGDDYEHNELGYAYAALRREVLDQADADDEYRRGLDGWRRCMRERGLDEERPAGAAERLAAAYREERLSLDALRVQEVAIATADAECYARADLVRVRRDAETRAEARTLAQNRDKLAAMVENRERALARAEALFTTGTL